MASNSDSSQQTSKRKKQKAFKVGSALINEEEIELLGKPLGAGMFGKVYKGKCRGTDVAVKIPNKNRLSSKQLRTFQEEMEVMKKIPHPNVCLFMGASFNPKTTKLQIVVELCKGDLHDLVLEKSDKHFPLSQRLNWGKQAATGLAWLHDLKPNPILHRDLKLANLLYDADLNVKVADFGLSQVIASGKEVWDKNPRGSLLYMGPEVYLQNHPISDKTDVHSFAMVLWELCSRREVYEEYQHPAPFINDAFVNHKRPPLDKNWPKDLQALFTAMWDPKPANRPPMKDVVNRLEKIIEEVKKIESINIIKKAIRDPCGQKFWIEHYLGKTKVAFNDFSATFFKYLQIPLPEVTQEKLESGLTDAERQLAAFRDLVQSDGMVSIVTFGKLLAWFAPLEVPSKNGGFLDRIVELVKQTYFHATMSAKEAENKLCILSTGSFLVRFSGRTWGGYTISVVNRDSALKHYVVFQEPGKGFRLDRNQDNYWKSISALIDAHSDSLYLQYPCGGNPFGYLFATKSHRIDGYQADYADDSALNDDVLSSIL